MHVTDLHFWDRGHFPELLYITMAVLLEDREVIFVSVQIALALAIDDMNLRGKATYGAFSNEWRVFLCGT